MASNKKRPVTGQWQDIDDVMAFYMNVAKGIVAVWMVTQEFTPPRDIAAMESTAAFWYALNAN
jgi:hypothetical protein